MALIKESEMTRVPLSSGIHYFCVDGIETPVEIEDVIGEGNSCIVYRAKIQSVVNPEKNTRKAVIKEYFPQGLCSRDAKTNEIIPAGGWKRKKLYAAKCEKYKQRLEFEEEIYDMHPEVSVARIERLWEENNTYYAIASPASGESMRKWKRGRNLVEIVKVVSELCKTIGTLHANGYLFLDCKPDNLFVTKSGSVQICDFGSVVAMNEINNLDSISFSLQWSPMEQMDYDGTDSEAPLQKATDVYAIGAVMFWLLTGRAPIVDSYDGDTETDYEKLIDLYYDLSQEISLLRKEPMDVVVAVEGILRNSLNYGEPTKRYPNTNEMLKKLEGLYSLLIRNQRFERHPGRSAYSVAKMMGIDAELELHQKKSDKTKPQSLLVVEGSDFDTSTYNETNGFSNDPISSYFEVGIKGSARWEKHLYVGINNDIRFRCTYRNDSGYTQNNVVVKVQLAKWLEPVEGSVGIVNANHPMGVELSDSIFEGKGANVGSYSDKANFFLYFTARIKQELIDCGENRRHELGVRLQMFYDEYLEEEDGRPRQEKPLDKYVYIHMEEYKDVDFMMQILTQPGVWDRERTAEIGTIVPIRYVIHNRSKIDLKDVKLQNWLPEGMMYYIKGSGRKTFAVENHLPTEEVLDTELFETGCPLGDIPAGTNMVVTFKATVAQISKIKNNDLMNEGQIMFDGHILRDAVFVKAMPKN